MPAKKRNPNGAGSIWQRKDGRYEARVYVPQPDGTRKRKTVYGNTWEECDTKRQELVRRDRQGIPTPTRSAKLSEWLPYWLEEFIRPERKKTTYAKYETHVRLYLIPVLGSKRLESLGVRDVRRLITSVSEQASSATAKESHRVLRSALTAACREELIRHNVRRKQKDLFTDNPEGAAVKLTAYPSQLDEALDIVHGAHVGRGGRVDPDQAGERHLDIRIGIQRFDNGRSREHRLALRLGEHEVRRDELFDAVWPELEVSEGVLTNCVGSCARCWATRRRRRASLPRCAAAAIASSLR